MKIYWVKKVEKHIVGGVEKYYIVKAEDEAEALRKVGINGKKDEAYGFSVDIEELNEGNDVYCLECNEY